MAKRLPTEFAVNMNLEKMIILQQAELPLVNKLDYFDKNNPCHLYFICRRPRVSLIPEEYEVTNEYIKLMVNIHNQGKIEKKEFKFENNFKTDELELKSNYPFNSFQLINKETTLVNAKLSPFLQSFPRFYTNADFLDLEILYIGQSYGVKGARTAPDRLKSHSTLQGIYAEAMTNNPDSEIWLALASFNQINITMMDGRTKYSDEEMAKDAERRPKVLDKLNREGINEQQKINFTEAALIKYFQPPYNVIYKDSFPNPAHTTYTECYELDINAVAIEMQTAEMINCYMYSEVIEKAPWHMHNFLLNSTEERKSMFDFL